MDVRGTSIGKGWQGAVKKYGFSRGLMTHGSKSHRQHGSVGAGTTPGRIYPGKKMHSQMGNETVTARKLKVMRVEDDCIIVKGSVPGKRRYPAARRSREDCRQDVLSASDVLHSLATSYRVDMSRTSAWRHSPPKRVESAALLALLGGAFRL